MKKTTSLPVRAGVLIALSGALQSVWGADALDDDPSLEELARIEINSVSRRSQSLSNVPAAAFVISSEDIRRSGATALPDVLRMVPGIEVAQIDNGRYAVSSRGFNGRFSNKLQVLVDGRSIYSTFFSGVMWEHDPVALEDIVRIEVIRGPGAAMWGANAVNGVINIITRHSAAQTGGLAVLSAGSQGMGQAYARYGGRLDEETTWKLSLQTRHRNPSQRYGSGNGEGDHEENSKISFRLDRSMGAGSDLSVWADVSQMKLGDLLRIDGAWVGGAYVVRPLAMNQDDAEQSVTGRYRWLMGAVESSLQMSVAASQVEMQRFFREDRKTYDLDYQGRYAFGSHDLLWGATYRSVRDESVSSTSVLALRLRDFVQYSESVFVHDEWNLVPERLQFALGARWEHGNLGGTTFAPSASLMWTPSRTDSVWLKYAQAPRVPARAENHVAALTTIMPQGIPGVTALPVAIIGGNPSWPIGPEKMESYEIGYRSQLGSGFNFNLAAYRQRYSDRVSGSVGPLDPSTLPVYGFVAQYAAPCNCSGGWIEGLELAADWLVVPNWRMQLSYTWNRIDLDRADNPAAAQDNLVTERATPRHYGSLRSQWNVSAQDQFDVWLRGSAGFERINAPYSDTVRVPGYLTLDLRYARRVSKMLEISLSGRNLIGAKRYEFVSDYVPTIPVEIRPSAMLSARLEF